MSLMNARAFCPMRLPTTSAERKHLTRFRRRRSDSGTSVDVNVVGWQFEIFPNPLAGVEALKPNVSCVGRAHSSYPHHTESVSLVVAAPQADHISDDEPCRDISEHGPTAAHIHGFRGFHERSPVSVHSPQANGKHGCESLLATIAEATAHSHSLLCMNFHHKLCG